jgi:hypothetical protein
MKFAAFISYSHACDGTLAPAVQAALQRLGKPWYRRSAMRVFRDTTVLAASPSLWQSIEGALAESQYFLLLASPSAAHSTWVGRELAWWLANRSGNQLLILLTEGDVVWDPHSEDFDWERSTALPELLKQRFADEPLYVDVRWARGANELSLRHSKFRGAILDIAAAIRGVSKDELDSDDIRQHRRTTRLAWVVGAALLLLILLVALVMAAALKQTRALLEEKENVQQLQSSGNLVLDKIKEFSENDKAACDLRIAQAQAACEARIQKPR